MTLMTISSNLSSALISSSSYLRPYETSSTGYFIFDENYGTTVAQVVGSGLSFNAYNGVQSGTISELIKFDDEGEVLWKISGLSLSYSQLSSYTLASFLSDTVQEVTQSSLLFGGNDTLVGSAGQDVLFYKNGNDTFIGGAGTDTLSFREGGSGSFTVNLAAGSYRRVSSSVTTSGQIFGIENLIGSSTSNPDLLTGDAGNNLFEGLYGADIIDGGAGIDTASYKTSNYAITINLADGSSNSDGNSSWSSSSTRDVLTNIENVIGSRNHDVITGDAGRNTISGGLGNDTINGGAGIDFSDYSDSRNAIVASLATQSARGWGTDSLLNIEGLIGSISADTLIGSSGDDSLLGGGGADILTGGLGNDYLNGGTGIDTAVFASTTTRGATVDLSLRVAQATGFGNDMIANVENLLGGVGADALTGDAAANVLTGGEGNDRLNGNAGNDTLIGGGGKDILTGGTGGDLFKFNSITEPAVGGNADIILDFQSGIDKIDLSSIDANLFVAGNQAFTLVSAFTGLAGQLRFNNGGIECDVTGDKSTDCRIALTGLTSIRPVDLVL